VVSGENMNFGLVDVLDNAYDGKEAVITVGTDPGLPHRGRGEELRELPCPVTQAHAQIHARLAGTAAPSAPMSLSITSP